MSRNFWGEIKERHFYESLASVLYPKLIDTYSTQLEFQYPGLKDRDGISRYDVDLKVASPHVVEEVEIGRCPQIAFLLAQLGGYTSLLSVILTAIWVRRWPQSAVVQTYEARTFLLADRSGEPPILYDVDQSCESSEITSS
eukprot:g9047.t1